MKQIILRKKPEQMKARLLEAAEDIAAEKGVAAVTLDAVARQAGVSKGGLLYHYPTRQALIVAMGANMLARLDAVIKQHMTLDSEAVGRFTRAYIRSIADKGEPSYNMRAVGAYMMAMGTDEDLRQQWNDWLDAYLSHGDGAECSMSRSLARLAADGLWLAAYGGTIITPYHEVLQALLEMTYDKGTQ